ncbi:hypothetical protein DRP53_01075 [candidate division WOR-3 bacterium]|uniref:Uncharacterized protein n=1 Tax=candidate division WOR-3 bacterium TaxID=2052148 RepID=A0A660SL95_UNCW3|nr:MAG: hypothetical protein DRP53_01075 [candidate division WOR-3 bacterium]
MSKWFLLFLLTTGCPVLTTMETARINRRPFDRDPSHTADISQINFFGTVMTDTLNNYSICPYLIEGWLRWIVFDERLELGVNCGTSGIGGASKLLIIKRPVYVALRGGISGLPWIFLTNPSGGLYSDLIMSMDLGMDELYWGGKIIYWVRSPNPKSQERFLAGGGFLGFRVKKMILEAGCYRVLKTGIGFNPWGVEGYIPVLGIGFITGAS